MGPAFLVWSAADDVEEGSCAHTGPATIRRRRATRPDSTSRHSDRRNRPLMIYPLKFESPDWLPHGVRLGSAGFPATTGASRGSLGRGHWASRQLVKVRR